MLPTECLGELGGLAVPDTMGDFTHGHAPREEKFGGAVHADGRQMLPKRRMADLVVGALELAAGRGDAVGDVIERKLGRVFGLDDRDSVLEQEGAVADCA